MLLSKRLETIAKTVSPCKLIADIGTDHGFVPIWLVEKGVAQKAIASDVGKGPLLRAEEHVLNAGLKDRIDCRLGSGLQTLKPGEADAIVIAGMGGLLTVEILKADLTTAKDAEQLILSPHRDVKQVRTFLAENGFVFLDETMVSEDGKYYPVMKVRFAGDAERTETQEPDNGMNASAENGMNATTKNGADATEDRNLLSEEELAFGPILLKKKEPVFREFLRKEKEKTETILEKLKEGEAGDAVSRNVKMREEELALIERALSMVCETE